MYWISFIGSYGSNQTLGSGFKTSDQVQGQGAGRSRKRSPPHILADEHLAEACNPPRISADHWALVRRRRIETPSNTRLPPVYAEAARRFQKSRTN